VIPPRFKLRDELYRQLPDGTYLLVEGVVPRVELEKAVQALTEEREAHKVTMLDLREMQARYRLISKAETAVAGALAQLRDLIE
jgi:hypothetical protein